MARYSPLDYYQQHQQPPSTIDANQVDEDEMSVLDDKILDATSPGFSDRRASYDHATQAFSHRNSVWSNVSASSNQSGSTSHVGHSILGAAKSSFMTDGLHAPSYAQPWSVSRKESGSCTPTPLCEQFPAEGDDGGGSAAPFSGGAVGPIEAMPMSAMCYRGGMFAPGGVAMSPQSSQGWMPAPMDLTDTPAQLTKAPVYRNGSPMTVRRDGIRKKNARFEIPAERTLSNIDQLISQSTNEEDIKELKQQKRLLRNRQAALDSRQRKKLHTEKLEEEKKQFTQAIGELEEELRGMRIREAELLREKSEWMATQQQYHHYVEGLQMDKDEMIRVHTLETAELRKKNNILMETVEKLERGIKPAVADNVVNDFSGFESMMDHNSWEEFTNPNGLPMEANSVPAHTAASQSHAVGPTNERPGEKVNTAADCPFSWNAFYMCLLFGAFIASNSTSLPGRSLPQLSEEYRAESANVLKAVLASSPSEMTQPSHNAAASAPSAWPGEATMNGMEVAQMTTSPAMPSGLDHLHDTLVMPTQEQEREQVFSLSADQYNSLTTFDDHSVGFKPQQQSNLQQALAAMRNSAAQQRMHAARTSDVYTRSLMWDRVPEKVIRDFRRMVQEYGATPVNEEPGSFHCA